MNGELDITRLTRNTAEWSFNTGTTDEIFLCASFVSYMMKKTRH